jgi:hypothetical protein
MVVRAAVDPGINMVTTPFRKADPPTVSITLGVRSMISIFPVVFTPIW